MKMHFLLLLILLSSLSCNMKNTGCKVVLDSFIFPKDLIELEKKNYVCNNHIDISQIWYNDVKILFADRNFELIKYNSKIRLLIDKKENMYFVFKTVEPNDFTVNKINKTENREYGIYEIYLVNSEFKPIYSIMKDATGLQSLIKYENIQKDSFSYSNIELITKEMPLINTMSYKDLTHFFRVLCNSDYLVKDKSTVNVYSGKPVWDEY